MQRRNKFKRMKRSRVVLLWTVNIIAIIVVALIVIIAINKNNGIQMRTISADSDIKGSLTTPQIANYSAGTRSKLPNGSTELWQESTITIDETANTDICFASNVSDLSEIYLQTSNKSVISGFYSANRFDAEGECFYPIIANIGTTTITGGTYDGVYFDQIQVRVSPISHQDYQRRMFNLINDYRKGSSLPQLAWLDFEERDATPAGSTVNSSEDEAEDEIEAETRSTNLSRFTNAQILHTITETDTEAEIVLENYLVSSPESTFALLKDIPQYLLIMQNPEYTNFSLKVNVNKLSEVKVRWILRFAKS